MTKIKNLKIKKKLKKKKKSLSNCKKQVQSVFSVNSMYTFLNKSYLIRNSMGTFNYYDITK